MPSGGAKGLGNAHSAPAPSELPRTSPAWPWSGQARTHGRPSSWLLRDSPRTRWPYCDGFIPGRGGLCRDREGASPVCRWHWPQLGPGRDGGSRRWGGVSQGQVPGPPSGGVLCWSVGLWTIGAHSPQRVLPEPSYEVKTRPSQCRGGRGDRPSRGLQRGPGTYTDSVEGGHGGRGGSASRETSGEGCGRK